MTVVPAPSRSMVTGPAAISPSASPLSVASRGEFLGAERDQVALLSPKRALRFRHRRRSIRHRR